MTDKRNCGTCQHWGGRATPKAGYCWGITTDRAAAAFIRTDDEEPEFVTLPSFSCSLWEAKP